MSLTLWRCSTRIEISALNPRVLSWNCFPLRYTRAIYCLHRYKVCSILRAESILPVVRSAVLPPRLPTVSAVWPSCMSQQRDYFSTKKDSSETKAVVGGEVTEEKMRFFHRYHKMFKEYWYVMLPVHIATSIIWFGSFYYLATCGVDVVPLLEAVGLPDTLISPLRHSGLGYIATASAMYKLATPARYAVTLGGTSIAIRQLSRRGLIKPMPTKDQIKQMIKDKISPP